MRSRMIVRRISRMPQMPVVLVALLRLFAVQVDAQDQGGCFTSINTLVAREALVTDTSVPRAYALCGGTEFYVGTLDYNNELDPATGQGMIPLRPNLYIRCGDDGSRSNRCFVRGGDIHVDGTPYFGVPSAAAATGGGSGGDGGGGDALTDVVIEGLTFVNPTKHFVWLTKPGNVVFKDCEFRSSRTATPVLLDYFDRSAASTSLLEVTLDGCLFDRNAYTRAPSQRPSMVVANSRQNALVLASSAFTNNDYYSSVAEPDANGILIESTGKVALSSNCFQNNLVGVSPVVTYMRNDSDLANNYVAADSYGKNAKQCPFLSNYETGEQFEAHLPSCTTHDATECASTVTSVVTASDTGFGTATTAPSPDAFIEPGPYTSDSPSTFSSTESIQPFYIPSFPTPSPTVVGSTMEPTLPPFRFSLSDEPTRTTQAPTEIAAFSFDEGDGTGAAAGGGSDVAAAGDDDKQSQVEGSSSLGNGRSPTKDRKDVTSTEVGNQLSSIAASDTAIATASTPITFRTVFSCVMYSMMMMVLL